MYLGQSKTNSNAMHSIIPTSKSPKQPCKDKVVSASPESFIIFKKRREKVVSHIIKRNSQVKAGFPLRQACLCQEGGKRDWDVSVRDGSSEINIYTHPGRDCERLPPYLRMFLHVWWPLSPGFSWRERGVGCWGRKQGTALYASFHSCMLSAVNETRWKMTCVTNLLSHWLPECEGVTGKVVALQQKVLPRFSAVSLCRGHKAVFCRSESGEGTFLDSSSGKPFLPSSKSETCLRSFSEQEATQLSGELAPGSSCRGE